MSKWIRFSAIPSAAKRKTGAWIVETKEGGAILGHISWWSPWRKYSFFPNRDTLYEQTCLRDIAQFIDEQMLERKKALGRGEAGEGKE